MTKNDGGPAFPTEYVLHESGAVGNNVPIKGHSSGMTLRDWFAGQALYAARSALDTRHIEYKQMAAECYALADAMLSHRNKE